MVYYEQQYYEAIKQTLKENFVSLGRNDVPVIKQVRPVFFEITLFREGLPLLRGKKMFPTKPLVELIWMLKGRNDLEFLHKYGVNYWDLFDIGNGTIGNSYGPRIRNFNGIDQLEEVVYLLKNKPTSRRIAISFWNPIADINSVVPCYSFVQFKVIDNYLNIYVTQRSGDAFLGVPNDVLLFAYLLSILSYYTGLYVGSMFYTINDFHIYQEHLPAVNKYLSQYEGWYPMYTKVYPVLTNDFKIYEGHTSKTIDELLDVFIALDFKINYNFKYYKCNPYIKADVIK